MSASIKNFLIGIFVIAACIFIVSIVLFLRPSVGDGKKILHVRFSSVNQINIGTRVLFAGLPVGEVVAIEEIYNAREQPSDVEGQVYFYQLTLRVDSSVEVYNTDEIVIQTTGLLGEKSIAIVPKAPPPGVQPDLIVDQPIYVNSEDPLQHTVREVGDLAKKINQTIEQMEKDEVFKNISIVAENLKNTTRSIDLITQTLAEGKGTFGKILKSDEMYFRMTSILTKVDTLMNDLNRYGLLFHLNKSWQRVHTQRNQQLMETEDQ